MRILKQDSTPPRGRQSNRPLGSCRTSLLILALWGALWSAPAWPNQIRVATYNMQCIGDLGTQQYNALVDVAQRIDASVLMVQEVCGGDLGVFDSFVLDAGYYNSALGETSGSFSGGLRNAVLTRNFISEWDSLNAVEISGDPLANDMTRDIVEARIAQPDNYWLGVFVVHLKSGSSQVDKFRRQVEIIRLRRVIFRYLNRHPEDRIIVTGDFNEEDGVAQITWYSLPSGLPTGFHLGSDITFPITYRPFDSLRGLGLDILDATQEDTTTVYSTHEAGRRLDYVWIDPALSTTAGDEVYNSERDNGIDDPPPGNFLAKSGSPLPSDTSLLASDHYAVFAEVLPNVPPPPTPTPSPTITPTPTPVVPTTGTMSGLLLVLLLGLSLTSARRRQAR